METFRLPCEVTLTTTDREPLTLPNLANLGSFILCFIVNAYSIANCWQLLNERFKPCLDATVHYIDGVISSGFMAYLQTCHFPLFLVT